MKKLIFPVMIFAFVLTFISCKDTSNKENTADTVKTDSVTSVSTEVKSESKIPDFSGTYTTANDATCKLTMILTKNGDSYNYKITGEKYDKSGTAKVEDADGSYGFVFDGKFGKDNDMELFAQVEGSNLVVQNYGNSMNEFIIFPQCDSKYLEFVK